jgi:hypothetical protein
MWLLGKKEPEAEAAGTRSLQKRAATVPKPEISDLDRLREYYKLAGVRKRGLKAPGGAHTEPTLNTRCCCSEMPAQEALGRAINRDEAGQQDFAIKTYRQALKIIYEGLALSVPNPGLGPQHSNVAKWRSDMNKWQQEILDRCAAAKGSVVNTGYDVL